MKEIICLANSILNPRVRSGGDIIFMELAKRLPPEWDIRVVTSEPGAAQWKQETTRPIRYDVISTLPFEKELNAFTISFSYVKRSLVAAGLLSRARPSRGVIIYSSSDFLCDVWPAVWLKMRKAPVQWVARVYHIIPSPRKRKGALITNTISFLAQRFSFFLIKKFADRIISLNASLTGELRSLGFPMRKITENGAGIDFSRIDGAVDSGKKEFDGVFFGRIMPQKGIYDCLKIWKEVCAARPEARLAIIGGGSPQEVSRLNEEIQGLGIAERVRYFGFVESSDEVYALLKKCKVYMFCDHENGWGISVAEGMACGLAVVAYDLPIFGAVHKQGFITVPLLDTAAFAAEVTSLLDDSKRREALAGQSREQSKEYDWSMVTDRFLSMVADMGEGTR